MDQRSYEREVKRLESELNNLDSVKPSSIQTISPSNSGSKIIRYFPYAIISILSFVFLILIKPKVVLKITIPRDEPPQMIIDKGKLIVWWLIWSVVGSIGYLVWHRLKKTKD
jgi:tryptophan-rich sensory protein